MSEAPPCWLTRAVVGPHTVAARGLHDAYAWHQFVWRAFPGRDGIRRDFLTRLDDKPEGTQLLVISPLEPSRPDWLGPQDAWESKPIPVSYFRSRRYRFQLRANPTWKPVKDAAGNYIADAKRRKRRAVAGREDLEAWLRRKGLAGGFVLADSPPLEIWSDVQRFRKPGGSGPGRAGLHACVDFSGVLEVTDAPLFLSTTFARGVGSAKAFGFGLLAIAPI